MAQISGRIALSPCKPKAQLPSYKSLVTWREASHKNCLQLHSTEKASLYMWLIKQGHAWP